MLVAQKDIDHSISEKSLYAHLTFSILLSVLFSTKLLSFLSMNIYKDEVFYLASKIVKLLITNSGEKNGIFYLKYLIKLLLILYTLSVTYFELLLKFANN